MSLTMSVDIPGLNAVLNDLDDRVQAAARPAAQAAAQVLYDAVKVNVAAIGSKSGNLDSSIYQAFSQENSAPGKATYHVSWNARKAPHGHLVEFGHIQRYAVHLAPDGNWYTLVRPSMRGKPKPRRGASQATKDAYYVTLATPRQVAAKPFIRPAASRFDQAQFAAQAKFFEALDAK